MKSPLEAHQQSRNGTALAIAISLFVGFSVGLVWYNYTVEKRCFTPEVFLSDFITLTGKTIRCRMESSHD